MIYRAVLIIVAVLMISQAASAKNYVYRDPTSSLETEGYKLFASDGIISTVEKIDATQESNIYCKDADKNTASHIGDIDTVRNDDRLSLEKNVKISYSAACGAYYSVLGHLKTADDIRRLWLLFGDPVTDGYAVETIKEHGTGEDASVLIEMRRLATVSKYLEFFYTKNTEWRLTEYTFLSQAFKARKGKTLSPAFGQFITALLTGDSEKALQVVQSIDMDNLGSRFIATEQTISVKAKATEHSH